MNETAINLPTVAIIETEEFWRKHYEAFKASGLLRTNYSRKHQLVYHRFSYWCRRFNRALENTPDESASVAANFVPVHMRSEKRCGTGGEALCVLELGAHQRLLIYTPAAIETVLQVLRGNIC